MAQLLVFRTTQTVNPVGDPVIRRPSREHRDMVSALLGRLRHVVGRVRTTAVRG